VTTQNASFAELGVAPDLIEILARDGITSPFPIQTMAIPDAVKGLDVCGKAQTGSGKTLAFGLPMVERLAVSKPKRPMAMILVPTRELCMQISEALEPLVKARGFGLISVYGGSSMPKQVEAFRRGVEVVVATPGRLIDLCDRKAVSLADVEIVVIDEADQMADMGFLPQVHHLMRQIEADHQTMLFSATLDGQVGALVRSYMDDPVFYEVESETVTVETSEHRFLAVHHMDKPSIVARIAESAGRTLVFTRTKRGCDRASDQLRDLGVSARPIHGDLPQHQRERTLGEFVSGKLSVLVATNVAARGLHIDSVDVVIHYDPPEDYKTYLHRSGRTARAGDSGLVVTLVEWDQHMAMRRIQKQAGLDLPLVKMFSTDDRLNDLTNWEQEAAPEPKKLPGRRSRVRRRNRLL